MVEKKAGLTPLQIEVLEWIKAGQPSETFADGDDLRYRGHARWLEKFGLVSISGSGDSWRVKLTAKGRRWPEVPARLQPAPTPRHRSTKPKNNASSSAPARKEASGFTESSNRQTRASLSRHEGLLWLSTSR